MPEMEAIVRLPCFRKTLTSSMLKRNKSGLGWPWYTGDNHSVALGKEAELVVDHALVPEGGADPGGERGIAGGAGRQRHLQRVDVTRASPTCAERVTGCPAARPGWRTGRRTGRPPRPAPQVPATAPARPVGSSSSRRSPARPRPWRSGR